MSFRYGFSGCLGVAVAVVLLIFAAEAIRQNIAQPAIERIRKDSQLEGEAIAKKNGLNVFEAKGVSAIYDENEVRAGQQFEDQWIAVQGIVSRVGRYEDGRSYIILDGAAGCDSVVCAFLADRETGIAELKSGDEITLGGQCIGTALNEILVVNSFFDEPPSETATPVERPSVTFRRNAEAGKVERIEGDVETSLRDDDTPADSGSDRPAAPTLRTWTSADGTGTIKAAFVKGNPTHITLEKADGTRVQVKRDELSLDDLEYIRKRKYKQGQ